MPALAMSTIQQRHTASAKVGCDRGKHEKGLISLTGKKEVSHLGAYRGWGKDKAWGGRESVGQEGQHKARISDALSTTHPWKKAAWDWRDEVDGHVEMSPATGMSSGQTPSHAGQNHLSAETSSNTPFNRALKLPHCFGWKETLEIQLQKLSE